MSNTLDCTIVSAECDCCLLIFSNAAGVPIKTLSLTGLQVNAQLDGKIRLQDEYGVGLTLTAADFTALGLTVQGLLDKRKECNRVEDTTEPPEPIDPIKKPQGNPFSAHPIGNKTANESFQMWCDELGNVCITPFGENANDTGATIITLLEFNTDYTMANQVGLPQFLPTEQVLEVSFEWCPAGGIDGTYADVLAAAIAAATANGGGTLPNGNTPDGMVYIEVQQEYKGQLNQEKVTTSVGTQIGNAPFITTLDGGQKFCEKKKYEDKDCDNKADACHDLTIPFVSPDGAGHLITILLVECDPDPTTPNLSGGGK